MFELVRVKGINRKIVVLKLMLISAILMASCSPPEDPVKCSSNNFNCTITNSYGAFPDRSTCRAAQAVYPTTEEELIAIVANATMQRMKMRVATRYSHSIPKLVCPEGDDGLVISTKNLNKIVKIDKADMTISVESGVTLKQLIEESAKAGLALPYSPYWWGLTIGGLLSTGAHGSTLWGLGSAVHNYVTQLRLVTPAEPQDGYVKVRTLVDGDPNLNAAKVSIGVLGVISQVTLKLQPLFKRSITYEEKSDSDLEDQAISFGNQHEFADLTWLPSQQKVVYRIDDRVSSNESGNGVYDYIGFRSQAALALAIIRTTEEAQEFLRDAAGKCASAKLTASALQTVAYGLTNNDLLFTGYPVVGYQNRFQSSGACLDSLEDLTITACPWDPRIKGLFFHQTAFTIALSKAKNFIGDVKKLIALEPTAMCNVEMYNGLLIRYDKASSAYLGKQEDSIEFEMTYFRSNEPMTPRLNEDILEEVEQIAFFKYGGLPHWGKNRNVAFDGIINNYKNASEFLKVKDLYDPLGLFSNEWTDQILGLKSGVMIYKEGCALEGLCICLEDTHCAPEKGYFCRPGRIYEDARVCTTINNEDKGATLRFFN